MVFSYQGEFSRFQVSKYIEYSEYTGSISLYIYCLITCNIRSLLNVPKISHISRKNSQVSRFPAKSADSQNKFVFLPKQPLLELSPSVFDVSTGRYVRSRIRLNFGHMFRQLANALQHQHKSGPGLHFTM